MGTRTRVRRTTGVPFHDDRMWGFGGNFVVILLNGVSAFRYADDDVHDPAALGLAAAALRPIC